MLLYRRFIQLYSCCYQEFFNIGWVLIVIRTMAIYLHAKTQSLLLGAFWGSSNLTFSGVICSMCNMGGGDGPHLIVESTNHTFCHFSTWYNKIIGQFYIYNKVLQKCLKHRNFNNFYQKSTFFQYFSTDFYNLPYKW